MKLNQLTFTRFLAAISIVIFHAGDSAFPFNQEMFSSIFSQANTGVSYFFVLSGFVMILAYGDKHEVNYKNYLTRRFARIYPVYLLATVLLLIFFAVIRTAVNPTDLFLNLTFLQSWVPGRALSFNTPAWSLSVEMFFYCLFPLFYNSLFRKWPLKKTMLLIVLFYVLTQSLLIATRNDENYTWLTTFPLLRLSEFLIGNVAGLYFMKGKIKKGNYDLLILALIVLFVVLLKLELDIDYHTGLMACIFVPFLLFLSANTGKITTLFNKKLPVFLGEISYGIYILQSPVINWNQGVMNVLGIKNPSIIFYSTLTILIILSALGYKFFETPIRKIINKNTYRQKINCQNVPLRP